MKKLILIPLLLLLACSSDTPSENQPRNLMAKTAPVIPVDGSAICNWCEQPVKYERYGGVLEDQQNQERIFMSAECMMAWMIQNNISIDELPSAMVVDFIDGKQLTDAKTAVYLHSKLRPSPGKMYLTAMSNANEKLKANIHSAYPGPFLSWEEAFELVQDQWPVMLTHKEN